MSTRSRFHTAVSALALATTLSGCGIFGGNRLASASDFRAKSVDVGLATRAAAALNANDTATAISFAERAVAQNPKDAGFRTLLGKAYFAAGRFASAEQAFKDSLSLYTDQPQVMLKLALVEIAQGKSGDALEFLEFARPALDPADYGLAVALAGKPDAAVQVLRAAAGTRGADARVRQNLALAYALAGDWVNARVVAAEDVSPAQLDQRIQEWMQFAGGATQPAARVAALVGVTPAALDPGQPVQLALVKPEAQTAEAAPVPAPTPAPAPQPEVSFAPPPPPVAPVAPVEVAQQMPQVGSLTVALPEARPAAEPAPAIVAAAAPSQDFPYVEVRKRPQTRPSKIAAPVRPAIYKQGRSTAVVQLGAYANPRSVAAAWNAAARRYAGLAKFRPVSARFASAAGPVYRLSVHGFANPAEAGKLCGSIKRKGGNCFVRAVAGDRPVQLASR